MKKTLVLAIVAGMLSAGADSGGGAVYYVPTSTTTVDGDTFCGGGACTSADTIIIRGGARGGLKFQDFDGAGSYITITNENTEPDSKVEIDGMSGFGCLSLSNCKYVDLRGDNDGDLAYGIKVINDATSQASGSVWVYGESDHIKISYLEITCDGNTSISGIGIQVQDGNLTNAWTFNNFEIHHNYIHDTRYSAMYLGHNDAKEKDDPYVSTFSIHDNIMEDMGSYGITLKGVDADSGVCSIYNNTIRRTGIVRDDLSDSFKFGIGGSRYYGSTYAIIYNNWIEKTVGAGIQMGDQKHNIYNNTIVGCGSGNDPNYGHGIVVHSWGGATYDTEIYDNIIVQAYGYGIKELGDCTNMSHKRNLIGDSGLGEADGNGLVEGTGADANIYHADVADFNFNVWSDDNDYSNDDFSLRDTPLLQIPQTGWSLVYVDSEEMGNVDRPATNSFDGDPDTFWHTEWSLTDPDPGHPHEIQIDLGSFYDICGFRYLPRQDEYPNGMIKDYEFYVSNNTDDWGSAVASGTFANDQTEKQVSFDCTLGQHVRLIALSEVNDNPWTTIAELNVLAVQPDSDINDE